MKLSSFKRTYTFPFRYDIPSYTTEFIKNTSIVKRYIKFVKRYLYLLLKGQNNLEVDQIYQRHHRILWINKSAPSLGDSLMDLSSRAMLSDKKVVLFTDIKNAHIYQQDHIFSKVVTNINQLKDHQYDLVIIDSYGTKSMKIKSEVQPKTPFVGMYGYYNGPEVNRALFSFHRMNQLLGYSESETEINSTARATMNFSKDAVATPVFQSLNKYIAIALGGEWDYRTYDKWSDVIDGLFARSSALNIALVGSSNAMEIANELISAHGKKNIVNMVNQLTFVQTASVIKDSQVLLCCDGGLMHAANAVGTPIIPLFARLTPEMQLTHSVVAFSNFDELDVKKISVESILTQYDNAYKFLNI